MPEDQAHNRPAFHADKVKNGLFGKAHVTRQRRCLPAQFEPGGPQNDSQTGRKEVDRNPRDQLVATKGDGRQPMNSGEQQRRKDARQCADPD